jgi:hypothetical protein
MAAIKGWYLLFYWGNAWNGAWILGLQAMDAAAAVLCVIAARAGIHLVCRSADILWISAFAAMIGDRPTPIACNIFY